MFEFRPVYDLEDSKTLRGRHSGFDSLASPGLSADSYSTICTQVGLPNQSDSPRCPLKTCVQPMPSRGPSDRTMRSVRSGCTLIYLYGRINYERIAGSTQRYTFRLQRITELLKQLGLADYLFDHGLPPLSNVPKVPLVHIAGTKGKGSTAAMVSSVLTAAGLRTGLYTSPHLHRLEERFRIDSVPCSADQLLDLVQRLVPAVPSVERCYGPPSFFDLTTALAMLHFDSSKCDAIVLEVGLGGRLDSTNVCSPSVTAITSIGLDHQHVLGETLTVQIAAEKSGIIKPNVPVVSGVADPDAAGVIAAVADKHQCQLFQLGRDFDVLASPAADWGARWNFAGLRPPLRNQMQISLRMEGDHQSRNAAIAIAVLDLLRDQRVEIPTTAIEEGFGQLQCIARVERFSLPNGVIGIVDAAHNRDSIAALCQVLGRRGKHPISVVFGTSIDKQAEAMLASLGEVVDRVVLTRFWGNPRFRPPQELVPLLPASLRETSRVVEDPVQACLSALPSVTPGGTLVVCGSFFLAAETRQWFGQSRPDRAPVSYRADIT